MATTYINGIKHGTTKIIATYTDGSVTKTSEVTFVVNTINASLSLTVNSTALTYNGSQQLLGTVNYNGDGQAKYYISTTNTAPSASASGWVNCSNGTQIKQTNAGTYYIFLQATAGTNYNAVGVKAGTTDDGKTIQRKTPTLTFTAVSGTLTYNGSNQNIGTISYDGDGTFSYAVTTSNTKPSSGWTTATSGTTIQSTAATAQTYYVWLKSTQGTNYLAEDGSSNKGSKAIGKATVNVTTEPAYVTSTLTYNGTTNTNGSAQTLVQNNGVCSTGGTFYYYVSTSSTAPTSFSTSSWSTTRPTGTNAGNYYVWYYCNISDTTNYQAGTNASAIKALANSPKNIGRKKTATATAVTGLVYNGTTENNGTSQTGVNGSTVTWTGNTTGINAGSYSASATPQSNFAWSDGTYAAKSVSWSIARRGQTAPVLSGATTTYPTVASASVQTAGTVEDGTATAPGTLTWTNQTRSTYGSQTATAYYAATTTNFSASPVSAGVTVQVNKRTVTITEPTFASGTLTYNKSAQTISAGGSCTDGGTMYYYISTSSTAPTVTSGSAPGTGWSTTTPITATNADTYYVWYYCYVSDTTNNQTASTGKQINNVYQISGSKVINQKEVSLSWGTHSWTYDGTEKTVTCTAGNVISGDTCTVTLSNNKRTNQGTQTVTASSLSNSNYKLPSTKTTTLTISKRPINVTAASDTKVFNNTALTNNGATAEANGTDRGLANGHTMTSCTVTGSQTTVGSSSNVPSNAVIKSGSTDVTSNYDITYVNGTLTVTKANLSVTEVNYSGTYDGSEHKSTVKVTSAGWDGATIKSGTTSGTYGTTVTSSGVVGTAYALKTATNYTASTTVYYKITGGTNFNDYEDSVTFQISKAANANVNVTINSATLIYNGSAQTLATATATGTSEAKIGYKYGSAATSDGQITWVNVGTNLTATNAGTYYIYRKWTADGNHSNSQSYVLVDTNEIELRPVNVTAGSTSRAYNGSALTYDSATGESTGTNRGLVSGHQLYSCTVTGSQTYVGSSNNVPSNAVIKSGTTDVTSNYEITYVNGTLTITKATPTVTVTGVTKDYTGGSFYATAKANAIGTLYWKRGSAPTTSSNDGSVKLSTLNTNTNVTFVKDNADDFDMYWLFVPSSSDNITTGQTYAANFTNAGGGSSDKVNLTINPRDIANITASAATVTYNGSSQTAALTLSDSGGNLTSNDYTISGNSKTAAGSYTITLTGKNNYEGTKTISWTINKRPVTITGDSASKVYDGTALSKNSVTASAQNNTNNTGMISSHHVHSWTVSGTRTVYGTTNNVPTAATIYNGTSHGGSGDTTDVTSNYEITFANGTISITKFTLTATATDETKVYDGTKLTASNTGSINKTLPTNHTITYNCSGEIGPSVSNGAKTLSSVVIKNGGGTDVTSSFDVTLVNGTLSITRAAGSISYTVNSSPASKPCTSQAKTCTAADYNIPFTIATSGASTSTNTGVSITYSVMPSTYGITVASDGKTLTVASGVNASSYAVTVRATAPATTNYSSVYVDQPVTVIVDTVALSSISLTLASTTVSYGASTSVSKLTAYYTNSASKDLTSSIGIESNSNPRVYASDTTIATVTN